jgi:hypothetical protein
MSKGLGKSILELSRDSIRVAKEMSSLSEEKITLYKWAKRIETHLVKIEDVLG